VAWHISTIAQAGLLVSSIGCRLAGIANEKAANPCASADVRVILAGIRRTLGTAPRRKQAATADRVRQGEGRQSTLTGHPMGSLASLDLHQQCDRVGWSLGAAEQLSDGGYWK